MSNYTRLSATGMRTISAQWLRDPDVHAILAAHAKTAALLPDVAEAHDALCAALGEDTSPLEQQIQALSKEGAVLDEQHDRKYRGSWKLIDALVELTEDPETAKSLIALRDKLQPGGLLQVNASWIDEAGNAATVRQSLDKPTRAELKRIPSIEGRTLDDEMQAWLKAGEQLGPVAAKKAALEHQLANPEEDAESLRPVRLGWIKIARALESNLDLVKKISNEDRGKVLGLLHQSAANAERRGTPRRKPEPAPAPTPAPVKPA